MWKRILIIVAVLVVLGAGGYWAWITWGPDSSPAEETLGGSGTIEAEQVAVSSVIAGRIATLTAEPGFDTEEGAILFQLDSELLDLQVDQAEAGVKAARAQLEQLRADNAASASITQAEARLEQAEAALEMARVQAGYATIFAPVAGRIVQVTAAAGENAAPGKTLAVIADLDALYIDIYVPESSIARIQVGSSAKVTAGSSAEIFEASVTHIASEAEFTPSTVETKEQRAKLVYKVRLSVTDRGGVLRPGMTADVTF